MTKKLIFSIKAKNALKDRKQTENISFSNVKTIGIAFDGEKQYADSKSLIKLLEEQGKKVEILVRSDKKTAENNNEFLTKDFKWYGANHSQTFKKFANTPFDYILFLHKNPSIYIQYLLSRTVAKSRVGVYSENFTHLFDLMFAMDDDISHSSFTNQALNYLNKIKN